MFSIFTKEPSREYVIIVLVLAALGFAMFLPSVAVASFVVIALAALPVAWRSVSSLWQRKMSIDTFNLFAVVASLALFEVRSAAFIVLMLTFADILEWRTRERAQNAIESLLRLKPTTAFREGSDGKEEEVPTESIRVGDICVVKNGGKIPVDGVITFGHAELNESPITGESALVNKVPGDKVFALSLNESGIIKIRATGVGKDSTAERIAALITDAVKHKSHPERIADRFAGFFLPIVLAIGIVTFIVTKNIHMTAALFLVACADDMSVAIPLAVTASLGQAAKRGIIIKGGEWISVLAKADTLVLDKTGTLTYGTFRVASATIAADITEENFWQSVAVVEKYSEHPIGRALYRYADEHYKVDGQHAEYDVHKGLGIAARTVAGTILAGNEKFLSQSDIAITSIKNNVDANQNDAGMTVIHIAIGGAYAGAITVADIPRTEAGESIRALKKIGIRRVIILTGDTELVAKRVGQALGIDDVRPSQLPEDKLAAIDSLIASGARIIMVGDGINDAPALSRADVGVAMGASGTAVTSEAADVVLLTDDLSRLPEVIQLSRRTLSVINGDIFIWAITNVAGFALVFAGILGPTLAAAYNFATDFLPLINSSRLFRTIVK